MLSSGFLESGSYDKLGEDDMRAEYNRGYLAGYIKGVCLVERWSVGNCGKTLNEAIEMIRKELG